MRIPRGGTERTFMAFHADIARRTDLFSAAGEDDTLYHTKGPDRHWLETNGAWVIFSVGGAHDDDLSRAGEENPSVVASSAKARLGLEVLVSWETAEISVGCSYH